MSSKPKSRTFIILKCSSMSTGGRFKVGARNEKEAISLVAKEVGKHVKLRVYYEDEKDIVPYGTVIREC